nr:YugE family protein [Bacillus licheniformis]
MIHIIKEWDPFQAGPDFYETEAAEIVQAVYTEDDAERLGEAIQTVFEVSFDQTPPLSECKRLAERLLVIKDSSSC